MRRITARAPLAIAALAATAALAACGGDDASSDDARTITDSPGQAADLGAVKGYLLDHTEQLSADVSALRKDAEAYHQLAAAARFDHARMLREHRSEVTAVVRRLQQDFVKANPAYEQMEGVVAGVPELADFDVIIDAGGDASDPENAVPFSLETPAGKTYKQPGNFNYIIETAVYGTEPRFAAKGVAPDLDGDGRVGFGEALPDADFLVSAARDFEKTATELDAAARAWQPTMQDALTALVVMTPTMSEYFEAWRNSRAIAGSAATEKAFVAASRLQDIADILGGLVLIYDNVEPQVAQADTAQAAQTGRSLVKLRDFAVRLRDEEADGKKFTAADADVLGSDAQDQAEAIAGQISQAAGKLQIELES